MLRKCSFLWTCGSQRYFCQRLGSSRIVDIHHLKPLGCHTAIKGWVKGIRKMKDNVFIDVNDGSCPEKLQIVIHKSEKPELLSFGASIEAVGSVTMNQNNKLEMVAEKVTVTGACSIEDGYPFAPRKSYPVDYVRQYLHLRPRTNTFASLLRIRDSVTLAIHDNLHKQGYICVHTPILTSNDCEGAGEVFLVKPHSEALAKTMLKEGRTLEEAYFDSKVFLTVSGQLHLEAVVRGMSNAYTFGPTFRAENSRTRHHLAEFYMLELESAFIKGIDDLMMVIETFVKSVTLRVFDQCAEDIHSYHSNSYTEVTEIMKTPFGILSYSEAVNIINNSKKCVTSVQKDAGLSKEHELFLVKHNGNRPVFVIDWPREMKPFYMKQKEGEPEMVSAVDLLVPEVGELCGGSLREDNFVLLKQKLLAAGLEKSLDWYLELRKFGSVPSGGFGMGFERYLQFILGIQNIKDTIPFPRWPHNCKL